MVVVSWVRWGKKGGGNTTTNNSKHKQAQTKNYTLFLDSTLNPLRILNGWAHLDGEHIIGKGLMRGFERW